LIPVPSQRWHLTTLSPFFRVPLPSQFLHFCFFGPAGFGISSSRNQWPLPDQKRADGLCTLIRAHCYHVLPRWAAQATTVQPDAPARSFPAARAEMPYKPAIAHGYMAGG
jgi:hypothetical protein